MLIDRSMYVNTNKNRKLDELPEYKLTGQMMMIQLMYNRM